MAVGMLEVFLLLGVGLLVILCGLAGLIAGIVALVRINRSGGELRGRGFAVAAIVIGALVLLTVPVGVVAAAAAAAAGGWRNTKLRQEKLQLAALDRARALAEAERAEAAAGARALWKLRGGKVLVAGIEEEARLVVQALDPEGRDTEQPGTTLVFDENRGTTVMEPHRLGAGLLKGVETVFLVDSPIWDKDEAGNLARFVKRGGQLVVMARSRGAAFPQDLWPADGECPLPARQVLSELGSQMVAVRGIRFQTEPLTVTVPPGQTSVGAGGGGSVEVARMLELEKLPAGAATWARSRGGKPMIAAADFGKGRAVLVATTPKWGGLDTQPGFADLVRRLLGDAPEAGEAVPVPHVVEEEAPPAPIRDLRLAVDAEGRYRIGEELLDLERMKKRIREAAEAAGVDEDGLSTLRVRIDADRATPHSAVQDAMIACMEAKVWRLSCAEGEEGPLPFFLPKDRGPVSTQEAVRRLDEIVLHVGMTDEEPAKPEFRIRNWKTSDRGELVAHLKQLRQVGDIPVVIDGERGCPFRYVMQALDACAAATMTKVEFRASPADAGSGSGSQR